MNCFKWTVSLHIANYSKIFDNNNNVSRKGTKWIFFFSLYCLMFAASSVPLTNVVEARQRKLMDTKSQRSENRMKDEQNQKLFKYLLLFGYSTFCHSVAIQMRLAGWHATESSSIRNGNEGNSHFQRAKMKSCVTVKNCNATLAPVICYRKLCTMMLANEQNNGKKLVTQI